MGRSQRLRLGQVRAVFRLLGEVRDLGGDPMAWRAHTLRELRRMIGGTVAMTLDLSGFLPGRVPAMIDLVDLGWESDRERHVFLDYLDSDLPKEDPALVAWLGRMGPRRFSTATRREVIDDRAWYAAPVVSEGRRSSRIDDWIVSTVKVGRVGRVQGFEFYRPWGARGFDLRERNLVRLFHAELLRVLRDQARDGTEDLPPYLHRVYRSLMLGRTSKQVARDLGLSVHTVDGYIKGIYRRFGVGSRPQLLALRLAARTGGVVLPSGLLAGA